MSTAPQHLSRAAVITDSLALHNTDEAADLVAVASLDDARHEDQSAASRESRVGLRTWLVALDAGAAYVGWLGGFLLVAAETATASTALWALVGAAACLLVMVSQRLYQTRVSSVRALEIRGLGRAAMASTLVVAYGAGVLEANLDWQMALAGGALAFGMLVGGRSIFRARVRAVRRTGRMTRPIVLVGGNDEAVDLWNMLREHPDLGFDVVAAVADRGQVTDDDLPVVGRPADTLAVVRHTGATGVLIAASALAPRQLNALVRQLVDQGTHVHLSSGLRGLDHRRVRAMPVGYEPLFYIEKATFTTLQAVAKRVLDIAVAAVAAVVAVPVLAICAVLVKLEDGGPVLFRQTRVGHFGREFTMLKLRTMTVDAEARLSGLRSANQRDSGPLFKLSGDPRVTRVGRVLRALSLDELPQVWNVVRGDMSIVGPRPALPSEVAQFDDELKGRTAVKPGITGLWQVEARDNPAFGAYRRLDLFYAENWSLGLDLSIILATASSLAGRTLRFVARQLPGRGLVTAVME